MRSRPDIVVATPGRIIDHLRNSMSVDLDDLAVLILDEADRLLELGFSAEIQELVSVSQPYDAEIIIVISQFLLTSFWKTMSNTFEF